MRHEGAFLTLTCPWLAWHGRGVRRMRHAACRRAGVGVGVALGLQLIAAARTKKKASERIECSQRNGNEIYLRHYEEA